MSEKLPERAGRLTSLRRYLPTGNSLDDEAFESRHRLARVGLVALVLLVAGAGVRTGRGAHLVLELLPLVAATVAAFVGRGRTTRMLAASAAMPIASASLVHVTNGLIESHFLFFVLLPVVALYQDWRAFLGSIGLVVIHHAVAGTIRPADVYNHPAAIADPILWALIHAGFVVALVVILIIAWNFSEAEQERTRGALRELHAMQDDLLQARKLEAVGQLAAGVAHEINTPIQFVSDNLRFLESSCRELLAHIAASQRCLTVEQSTMVASSGAGIEDSELLFLSDEVPQAISQSMQGIERVSEIVLAMKGFAHLGQDEWQVVDLNQLIRDTVVVARSEWRYAAEMELALDGALPPVRCLPGPVTQVVLNMVVNASHAVTDRHGQPQGELPGRIRIATVATGDQIELRVSDNGCGISSADIDRVFDQFFTTKAVGRGTGQGLAIAHRIVTDQHGGRISIASELGEGTTVIVALPVVAGAEGAAVGAGSAPIVAGAAA